MMSPPTVDRLGAAASAGAAVAPSNISNDLLGHRLETLHQDVNEVKAALKQLADAVIRLALVEERQAQAAAAQDRAIAALERIEERVTKLEMQAPAAKRASIWIDRAAWASMAAVAVYVAKATGLTP